MTILSEFQNNIIIPIPILVIASYYGFLLLVSLKRIYLIFRYLNNFILLIKYGPSDKY